MSPVFTWEGPAGEMPAFCPNGCGGVTEDPYGGPCKACWNAVGKTTEDATRCPDHRPVLDLAVGWYCPACGAEASPAEEQGDE